MFLVKLIEPPYAERLVRWCERSGAHRPLLLDLMRIIGVIVGCLRGITVIVQRSTVACAGVLGDQERNTVAVNRDQRSCHGRSASVHSD